MLSFLAMDYYSIIITVAFVILLIICLLLIHKVTSLKEKVELLEIKNNYERKVIVDKENTISIKKISEEKKVSNNNPAKKEEKIIETPIPNSYDNKELDIRDLSPNKEDNYLKEVSKKLQEEINHKPIELTDYEKEEESNAVISYKELLNKEEKTNIDKTDTNEFIEQLKKLRNSL